MRTNVSEAFLRTLALSRPALKMHPVPKIPGITSKLVAQEVEHQLARRCNGGVIK